MESSLRKTYASLAGAKGRRSTGLFMAQGTKCVLDTLGHFRLRQLLCTHAWAEAHLSLAPQADVVKPFDIERICTLSTPPGCIAIYEIPDAKDIGALSSASLYLALDCVQDPGNLGTILRVADWMGVRTVFASPDTADVWSPKVVQASMGAISRVEVRYLPLAPFLASQEGMAIYGTFLDGQNIYKSQLTKGGIIAMGNEGKGLSAEVAQAVNRRLYIPPYPVGAETSESLNVAIATAITLSEFRRNG